MAHIAEQAVSNWLEQQYPYPGLAISRDDRSGEYLWSDEGGAIILVSVKYFPKVRKKLVVYHRLKDILDRFDRNYESEGWGVDNIMVFLVFESERAANTTVRHLPEMLAKMGRQHADIVVAHLPKEGGLRVQDPLNALPDFS